MFLFPTFGFPSLGLCYLFQDLVTQVLVILSKFGWPVFSKTWLSKFWFISYCFPKTWLSKFWFILCFPRLGCPSFGLCCVFQDLVVQVLVYVVFPRLGCPSFGLRFCFPKLGCPSFGLCYFAKTWLSKFWFLLFFSKTWLSKFWFYVSVFQNLGVQVLVYVILPRLGCPSFGLCCLSHCQIFLPQHVTVRMLNIVEVAMLPGPDSASNRMKWLAFKPEGHFGTKLPGGQCVMKLTLSTVLLCVWRGTKHVCKIKPYHRNSQSLSVSNLSFITQSQLKFHDFQRSMLIDWFRQPFILLQLHFDIDSHLHDYDLWWI